MVQDKTKNNPLIVSEKSVKRFFTSSMKSIFPDERERSRYTSGDILSSLKNTISN